HVVAQKKYNMDFQAIRPTCLRSEWPAIPNTKVENKIGPTMVFTNLINPWLKGCNALATSGKSSPTKIPNTIQVRIHVVKPFRTIAFHTKTMAVTQRTTIIKDAGIGARLNS